MKINFTLNNDYPSNYFKQNISFKAGLTPKMFQEIQHSDVLEISDRLIRKGIPNDFKDNKAIAWISDKTVDVIDQLNKRFGLKFALPKGIYAENFRNLNVDDPYAIGTCNLLPTHLKKGSDEVVPSRIVLFNTVHDWNDIDSISDANYAANHISSDFFLYYPLHEFSHAAHEDRLLNKLGRKKLAQILESLRDQNTIEEYRKIYGDRVIQICDYATNTPLDAVACDIPRELVKSLDRETLMLTKNPFIGTPYEKKYFWQNTPKYSEKDRTLNEILRFFWNGKFD